MTCQTCVNWGRTISPTENPTTIQCPDCKRRTWPNLGVNCPAGSAVALSSWHETPVCAGVICNCPINFCPTYGKTKKLKEIKNV